MTDTAPPAALPSPRRRTGRLVVGGVVALLCLLSLAAPMPVYVLSPGPVFPLGDAVVIEGVEPVHGDFLFTTVQLQDATLADALRAAVDTEAQVVSRAAVLGGMSEADFIAEQEQLFDDTEALAVGLGLAAVDSQLSPSRVTVDSSGVGGPSAGLLIALAVADLASPDDIAGGRLIAGTGALSDDGTVGAVGGVEDKVLAAQRAGADVFLVAAAQVEAARAVAGDMAVLGVEDLAGAVAALGG